MPKTIKPAELKTLREFAAFFAVQEKTPQCVVQDNATGNYYIVNAGQARRSNALTIQASFGADGLEKTLNANPVITFEASAMRAGANQHSFVVWRMEDGEATIMIGQGHYPGTAQEAVAFANAEITKALQAVDGDATKVTLQ